MKKSNGFRVILVMIIAVIAVCKYLSPLETYQEYKQDQDTIYVAFSNESEETDPMDYQEIADYQSVYSEYNSRLMYNTLSAREQQIYRLFEYALDKGYTTIFFDSRLLTGNEYMPEDILKFYSIDSPMVQQNYHYSYSETSYTFSYFWELLTFEVTGEDFTIENFSDESLQKKKEAIAVAEEIYAAMPPNLSQLEQARYFFRHITREVVYTENQTDLGQQHNLYDALVQKKTHCDGFSNAFSLLCAMAKIPCAEKVSSPKEQGQIGHTWNVFCADGVWYNADLALSEDYARIHKELDVDFSFGFSDRKAEDVPDFGELFPACTTDLIPVDFMVDSASDSKFLPDLKTAFKQTGKRFVYIGLENGELTSDDLQKVANYLRSDIRTLDETFDGKNYYYIFKK